MHGFREPFPETFPGTISAYLGFHMESESMETKEPFLGTFSGHISENPFLGTFPGTFHCKKLEAKIAIFPSYNGCYNGNLQEQLYLDCVFLMACVAKSRQLRQMGACTLVARKWATTTGPLLKPARVLFPLG